MPGMVRARVRIDPSVIQRELDRLSARAGKIQPRRISVGIHEADGDKPKLDYDGKNTDEKLVDAAAVHEFGDRSWLRTWFDQNRPRITDQMVNAMRAEFAGHPDILERQGEEWARELREWIEYGDAHLKPLKPSTVAAKERAGLSSPETPLLATGQLVAAIKSLMESK